MQLFHQFVLPWSVWWHQMVLWSQPDLIYLKSRCCCFGGGFVIEQNVCLQLLLIEGTRCPNVAGPLFFCQVNPVWICLDFSFSRIAFHFTSRVLVVFGVCSRGRNQMGLCPVFYIWQCWRYEGLNVKVTSLVLSRERISDIPRISRITVQMDHVPWSEKNDGQPLSLQECVPQ